MDRQYNYQRNKKTYTNTCRENTVHKINVKHGKQYRHPSFYSCYKYCSKSYSAIIHEKEWVCDYHKRNTSLLILDTDMLNDYPNHDGIVNNLAWAIRLFLV